MKIVMFMVICMMVLGEWGVLEVQFKVKDICN